MTPLPCVLEILGIRGKHAISILHPFHPTYLRHHYGQLISPHIDIFQRMHSPVVVGAAAALNGVLDASVLDDKCIMIHMLDIKACSLSI